LRYVAEEVDEKEESFSYLLIVQVRVVHALCIVYYGRDDTALRLAVSIIVDLATGRLIFAHGGWAIVGVNEVKYP
jgi:hypothetical protein